MTMPHVNSGGSEDFFSNDEVKVYKDEGEEEQRSSENLSEDKLGLVTETEEGKTNGLGGSFSGNEKSDGTRAEDGKGGQSQDRNSGQYGYISPYPSYPNGSSPLGNKFQPPLAGLMMYNNEHFAQPPPAHMGIPPVHIDPKSGLPRPPMYAYPAPGQFHPSLYGPDLSQVQWRGPSGYPISSGAFSGPYPPSLVNTSSLSRFGHPGLFPPGLHPGMPHPALVSPGTKQEPHNPHNPDRNALDDDASKLSGSNIPEEKKKNYVKKPLNAFMLFMKEMRGKVVSECTLKESAAINQILGRRWHALDRAEQAKYYEMARKEKELHMQLYPGWSARDNYACHTKKKRKKKDGTPNKDCNNPKKCRARYGVDQQNQWCKPCRRKKKCIRYRVDEHGNEYFYDGDDILSDSFANDDSVNDSDSMTGSPMCRSVTSDDAFSSPSKTFCRNSPSPLDLASRGHIDFRIKSEENRHRSGELDDACREMEDLDVTLTSTPVKSLHLKNNVPVT